MDRHTYIITFNTPSLAEGNQHAEELRHILLDATPDLIVERKRDDPRTQDFGTTLVLILGTSSVTIVARAMGDWLSKGDGKKKLTVKTSKGEIIAENLSSKDLPKLEELAEKMLSEK